jgi:predicted nucleic acid-binding protein
MKPIVVDTDVVSFVFKSAPIADRYTPHLQDRQLLISFMTEAELEQWVLLAGWGPKRIDWLREYLKRFLVVPSSRDLARRWAEARVCARRAGRPIDTADAWVAATAMIYGCPLVTRNKSDYAGVRGLELIS